jgi:hypothetical protein
VEITPALLQYVEANNRFFSENTEGAARPGEPEIAD